MECLDSNMERSYILSSISMIGVPWKLILSKEDILAYIPSRGLEIINLVDI